MIKTNHHRGLDLHWCWTLQWRHNERHGVSNHRRLNCLLDRLFRRRSKKRSKLRVTGLCDGNPPVTGGFPSQRASNMKMSPWTRPGYSWAHHQPRPGFNIKNVPFQVSQIAKFMGPTWPVLSGRYPAAGLSHAAWAVAARRHFKNWGISICGGANLWQFYCVKKMLWKNYGVT